MGELRTARIAGLALALTVLPPAFAAATEIFPSRPIKIIVGPSPDVFSRIVAEHLQQTWGQPVVIEPRTGAGGKKLVRGSQRSAHSSAGPNVRSSRARTLC